MKSSSIGLVFLALFVGLSASGCSDSEYDKQIRMQKMQQDHEIQMKRLELEASKNESNYQERIPPPNYVGNPQYGHWQDDSWRWNNPQGPEASSTMSYLAAAGIGAVGGYIAKDAWNKAKSKPVYSKPIGTIGSKTKVVGTTNKAGKALPNTNKNDIEKYREDWHVVKKPVPKVKRNPNAAPSKRKYEASRPKSKTVYHSKSHKK